MASSLPSQSQRTPDAANPKPPPRFNSTALAILGAALLAIVLTSLFINPIAALRASYQGLGSPKPIAAEPVATAPAAGAH